jgi:hypothetical protein
MVPQQRVSSDGLADGRSKDLPFLCLLSSFASLSLLILASAPEEDYVGLVPLMPRPSFLGAPKLARSIRRRKDRSRFTFESVTRRSYSYSWALKRRNDSMTSSSSRVSTTIRKSSPDWRARAWSSSAFMLLSKSDIPGTSTRLLPPFVALE